MIFKPLKVQGVPSVFSISLASAGARLNCKLVSVAGLATEMFVYTNDEAVCILQPFEREPTALFMSRALITGDGRDRFPSHICLFDSAGV